MPELFCHLRREYPLLYEILHCTGSRPKFFTHQQNPAGSIRPHIRMPHQKVFSRRIERKTPYRTRIGRYIPGESPEPHAVYPRNLHKLGHRVEIAQPLPVLNDLAGIISPNPVEPGQRGAVCRIDINHQRDSERIRHNAMRQPVC